MSKMKDTKELISIVFTKSLHSQLKAEAEKAAATCVEEIKAKREAMVKRCEQYEKEYAQVYDFVKFVYGLVRS